MICGFMHVYQVHNWDEIVFDQLRKIRDSGLCNHMDKLFVGINGSAPFPYSKSSKVEVIYHIDKPDIYDALTLNTLRNICHVMPGQVFYIHTKGVSRYPNIGQQQWRQMMEYYILERWERCLTELKNVDMVGVNWHLGDGHMGAHPRHSEGIPVTPHFSGNFFWMNSSYGRTLPSLYPLKSRFQCEFWPCLNNPTVCELWNSGIHHNDTLYPRSMYENRINPKYYEGKALCR